MTEEKYPQKQENLRKLLEQHWLHCRHVESERAWFMSAYAVVVGGVAAFLAGKEVGPSPILYFLLAFLIVFTFVGLFLKTRWLYTFECHRIRVNKLASIIWLESGSKTSLDPTMDIPAMHILPESICRIRRLGSLCGIIDELFRQRYWFALFYLFILIGFVIFSSIVCFKHHYSIWLLVLAGVALVVGFCLFCRWRFLLARIDKSKKVVLAGCNGEWAQKHYLPFLVEKAMIGDITLWAVDTQPQVKLDSSRINSLWRIAEGHGKARYLNTGKDMESIGVPRDVDYVFIVTPDWCHCNVAEFWLSRLSTNGKIFIEKPLDASKGAAAQLQAKIRNDNVVYGFDHYLAKLRPFLRCETQYLASIGDIKSLKINILENDEIQPHQDEMLREGVIFDLFTHVMAVSAAVVEKKLAPTEDILKDAKFIGGARDKYKGWQFPSETYARILFLVGNKMVTARVGKRVGEKPDKWMIIHGTRRRNIKFDFPNNSFSVNGKPGGKLDSKPVESFLEAVLAGCSIDSVPGVLSFGAAFAILKWLSDNKGNIIMGPGYVVGTVKPC